MSVFSDWHRRNALMSRAEKLGKTIMDRGPVHPFGDGRERVLLLLRRFRIIGLPAKDGTTTPIAATSFDAIKKYVYLFEHEFGGERMGHVTVPKGTFLDLLVKHLGMSPDSPERCFLILDEDVVDVNIPKDFVNHDGRPVADLTEEEAVMDETRLAKAKLEFMNDEFGSPPN